MYRLFRNLLIMMRLTFFLCVCFVNEKKRIFGRCQCHHNLLCFFLSYDSCRLFVCLLYSIEVMWLLLFWLWSILMLLSPTSLLPLFIILFMESFRCVSYSCRSYIRIYLYILSQNIHMNCLNLCCFLLSILIHSSFIFLLFFFPFSFSLSFNPRLS